SGPSRQQNKLYRKLAAYCFPGYWNNLAEPPQSLWPSKQRSDFQAAPPSCGTALYQSRRCYTAPFRWKQNYRYRIKGSKLVDEIVTKKNWILTLKTLYFIVYSYNKFMIL